MKKIFKIFLIGFFFLLPIFLLSFTSGLTNLMRWQLGSPLVPGYNWMRWSHVYLILGSLFCIALYVPTILAIVKKKQKILLIPFSLAILFILGSIACAIISKKVYYAQEIQKNETVLKLNPNDSIAIENKANAYKASGDYDKAIELYNNALEITSHPAYVYHDRGMGYFGKKEYDKAIADIIKAMEINPNEKDFIAQCYNDRSVIYFHSGQYDKSWQDVQKAQELGYNVHPGFLAALKDKGYSK